MIRVMLVDDQAMVRAGFRLILESEDDITVVGEAADGREAVDLAGRCRADVALMDVRMPTMDGIEATARITGADGHAGRGTVADHPPRVLMLTTFDLDDHVYAALRAGASGFLLKDAPAEQLIEAVRVVARGDALLAPSVTRRLIEEVAKRPLVDPHTSVRGFGELTDRELDVMKLVARGLSNAEIAETLFLGEATVKTHVGRILAKLDLRDRVQVVVVAYESGLVTPGDGSAPPFG
ncbi:MAG: response regulator transcription factor [Acidimicrobiales bacterium]|nr:response regulator transcription factor [Acidimicrobiales bacterium]MCB9392499.1 response regulator transcription factor [Acidimicrobiaceae bacterium]